MICIPFADNFTMIRPNLLILRVPDFFNLPIIYRFSPAIYRFSRGFSMEQRPTIDRRNPRIDRSGCRDDRFESSANRQMKPRNRQITPVPTRPSGLANHQLIVNRFPVIVNFGALKPSRIHQRGVPIHQFASESFTLRNQIRNRPAKLAAENIRNYPQPAWPVSATAENYRVARRQATFLFSESSDNHPTKRRNHPIEPANLPIIYRRIPGIYRSGQANKLRA